MKCRAISIVWELLAPGYGLLALSDRHYFIDKYLLLFTPGTCDNISHVVAQIKMACEGLACFYITDHGIDHGLMDSLIKCGQDFFNLPTDKKTRISLDRSSAYRGYIQQGT